MLAPPAANTALPRSACPPPSAFASRNWMPPTTFLVSRDHRRANDFPIRFPVLVFAEEATVISFVTGPADLFDPDKHHILVAVREDGFDELKAPAALALERQTPAAAAVAVNLAGLDRLV